MPEHIERRSCRSREFDSFLIMKPGTIRWVGGKDEVLPPLDLKMFWEDPQAAGRLAKIVSAPPAYHFEPARRGTQMKVRLEICDYFDEDPPEATLEEFDKLKATVRPIRLDWDSRGGKFKLVKP